DLRAAVESFPYGSRERLTVEYVVLHGVNDTDEDAQRLAEWVRGIPHTVNLIPFNDHQSAAFSAPSWASLQRFASLLHDAGVHITVRHTRGRDVQGACGQLVLSTASEQSHG